MTKPTLTQIKKDVFKTGGEYKKESFRLNGQDAYTVNGRTVTKPQLIEMYQRGEIA